MKGRLCMKSGKYGIYKGNEYKLSYDMKKNLLLITNDIALIDDSLLIDMEPVFIVKLLHLMN